MLPNHPTGVEAIDSLPEPLGFFVDDRAELTPDAFMDAVEDMEAREGSLLLLLRRDGWIVVSARRGGLQALEGLPMPQGS